MRKIEVNKIYKHFKGGIYKVIAIAKHTETEEELVVYVNLDNDKTWARPYDMFNSKVDHLKFPDVKQIYRFEEYKVEID